MPLRRRLAMGRRDLPMPASRRHSRCSSRPARGFTLIELLVVLAIAALTLAIGLPPLMSATTRVRLRLAAGELTSALRQARMRAVRQNAHVALRLTRTGDGAVTWALYADGDGDGVRTRDIRRGVDPQLQAPRRLRRIDGSIRPGFPPGPLPRDPADPHRRLHRRKDPLRFGRSDLVSFSPLGSSTSGTLYLTAGERWTAAVRVYGTTGKVKVLLYDAETEAWR